MGLDNTEGAGEVDVTLDDLISTLGGQSSNDSTDTNDQQGADDKAADSQDNKDNKDDKGAADQGAGSDDQNPPDDDASKQDQVRAKKASDAFAKLRVENASYEKTLKGIAGLLGIDMNNTTNDKLVETLQERITNAQAKQQGVPAELLKRLDSLEQEKAARELKDIRTQALIGFQKVKTKFNLDDKALQDFAVELDAEGKNPFTTVMDLEAAYITKHFNDIIEAAKAEGIKEEQERASKAAQNSSNPGNKQGASSSDDAVDSVKSIADLNKWFNNQNK